MKKYYFKLISVLVRPLIIVLTKIYEIPVFEVSMSSTNMAVYDWIFLRGYSETAVAKICYESIVTQFTRPISLWLTVHNTDMLLALSG
jgi:hypothetical protein